MILLVRISPNEVEIQIYLEGCSFQFLLYKPLFTMKTSNDEGQYTVIHSNDEIHSINYIDS
jgi:hypothetical protein